jgi:hypothetical protein
MMQMRCWIVRFTLICFLCSQSSAFSSTPRKSRTTSTSKTSPEQTVQDVIPKIDYQFEYSLGESYGWKLISRATVLFPIGKQGLDNPTVQLESASRTVEDAAFLEALKKNSWYRVRASSSNDSSLAVPIAAVRIVGFLIYLNFD